MLIILMEYAPAELRDRLLENVPESVWEMYLEEVHYNTEEELEKALYATAKLLNTCNQE